MLTYFYFDSELFDDQSIKTIPVVSSNLLELWKEYGCLGINNSDRDFLYQGIKKLPIKSYRKWAELIPTMLTHDIEINNEKLSSCSDFHVIKSDYSKFDISTALIVSDYKELYEPKRYDDEFEIICPSTIDESLFFNKSKVSSKNSIKDNENINDIWNSRFNSLSKSVKVITIIDRYFAFNLLEDSGYIDGKDKKDFTSLEFLIKKLSLNKVNYTINIFSSVSSNGKDVNCTKLKEYIDEVLSKKKFFIKSNIKINITLCKNKYFSDVAHDRMIKFGKYHVAEIGNGMDIFRQAKVKNNTMTIKGIDLTAFDSIYEKLFNNQIWNHSR